MCRRTVTPACWIMLVFVSVVGNQSLTYGHGIPFDVGFDSATGKITVAWQGTSPGVYRNFALGEMLIEDPEFGLITNGEEPGWSRTATLPYGVGLKLRFVAPLQYWNPSTGANDPLPIPGGTIEAWGGGTSYVSAVSQSAPLGIAGDNPIFLAYFTSHHHVAWFLDNPDAPGLYGLWATLESANPTSFAAQASDPFLVVLNYGVTDSTAYDEGVDRLAATVPVPEPGAGVMAITAVVGLAVWRRKSRRPPTRRPCRRQAASCTGTRPAA